MAADYPFLLHLLGQRLSWLPLMDPGNEQKLSLSQWWKETMAIYTSTVFKDNFEVFVLCLSFSFFCYFILHRLHSFDSCSFTLFFRLRLTWKTNNLLINYNALLKPCSLWHFTKTALCGHISNVIELLTRPSKSEFPFKLIWFHFKAKIGERKKSKTWIEVCVAELSWPLTFNLVTFRRSSTPRLETTRIKNLTEYKVVKLAPL